jgi:hypothetical protein
MSEARLLLLPLTSDVRSKQLEPPDSFLQQIKRIPWKTAPKGLFALFLFSLLIVIADAVIRLNEYKALRESLIPATGWVSGSMYLFIALMTFFFFLKPTIRGRKALILVFIIIMIEGLFAIVLSLLTEDFENPYLMVNKWRPIWSFLIPGFWISVLLSSSVKNYCRN